MSETSHYMAGIILRYYVYIQSRTGNLVAKTEPQTKRERLGGKGL